jgi:hypothetical protein
MLQRARLTFEQQAAPANTGYALQAKFLANVVREFTKAMQSRNEAPSEKPLLLGQTRDQAHIPQSTEYSTHVRPMVHSPHQQQPAHRRNDSQTADTTPAYHMSDMSRRSIASAQMSPTAMQQSVSLPSAFPMYHSYGVGLNEYRAMGNPQSANMTMSPPVPGNVSDRREQSLPGDYAESFGGSTDTGVFGQGDYLFTDDEMWAAMFANAGFNIDRGMFMPELMDTSHNEQVYPTRPG